MSGFVANFHFLRPWALLALAAMPLLWLLLRRGGGDAGGWRHAVDPQLLPYLIERSDGRVARLPRVLAGLGWLIACLALAGPTWERESMPLLRNEAARVFALELAPTMLAQDIKPSRLERARFKLDDMLARSRDYQTALVAYAGAAFVVAPLTDDVATVRHLVEALDPSTMPVQGNATGQAIDRAAALIEQAGQHQGQIVLLADSAGPDALAAARRARRQGYTLSVLGVGSNAGAPIALPNGGFLKDDRGNVVLARIDEAALRELAAAGGGQYAPLAADRRDLDAVLPEQAHVAAAKDASGHATAQGDRWRDRGPWLLLALLPLAAIGFRRGWLMLLVLALYLPAPSTQAASLADLWQRRDQQAAAALAQGDAKRAAQVAPDAAWRGSAAYREGDYTQAADEYARLGSADGAYNRGNALAQAGQYEDALAAYDDALKRAPGMADAIENRRIVEEALKQQQQQQQQQEQQGRQGQGQQQGSPKEQQQGQQQDPHDGEQPQDQQDQQGQQGQNDGERQSASSDSQSAGPHDRQQAQQHDRTAGEQQDAATQEQAAQQQADAQQREALSKSVDQALARQGERNRDGRPPQGQSAAPSEDDATREQRQALDQWLERVPDDPGGLLRRKFMLEYQRRQQGKGE